MTEDPNADLLEEAAMIFLAVSEDPADRDLIAERDRFLAQGKAYQQAYKKVEEGWALSAGRSRSNLSMIAPLLLALGIASYLSWEPMRIYMLADFATGVAPEENRLLSGDLAVLDAGSALADQTQSGAREVKLLKGSAYFDVATDDRPFIVTAKDVDIRVVGTAFETALMPSGVVVAVSEGVVAVSAGDHNLQLAAGDSVILLDDGTAERLSISIANVATWRGDQLVVNDMTVAQVADILDRRISGEVFVIGGGLSEVRVSGTFDLADPEAALKTLALIANARVINGAPLATLLMPSK